MDREKLILYKRIGLPYTPAKLIFLFRAHRLNRGGIGSPMGMPGSPDSFMDPSSPLAVSIIMLLLFLISHIYV